jgi:hypothetical protein
MDSYIFGFFDKNGELYDYHISDDLKESRTWEAIDFKFSLPDSKYMLVWRRDGKKIISSEAKKIRDYVEEDMKEYMEEGREATDEDGSQTKILDMLLPSKDCLVIVYDRLTLPKGYVNWKHFVDLMYFEVEEMIEDSVDGKNDSEKIEDILEGKMLDSFENNHTK